MKTKMLINKCCCCGMSFEVSYRDGDEVGRVFAEETDVCPACFKAGCRVLTGERCKVTGKKQVQLLGKKG
jgi:hypothetical protein